MSRLLSLRIVGIRSFSPNPETIEDQTIMFKKPLTVISGQNGCGKTTIIECLKYAATGSLPPGSSNGQSFVHHPGLTNETKVTGKIEMQFRGKHKKVKYRVTRIVQVTRKKTKLEFKQLEGMFTVKRPNEPNQDASSKCAELDKMVPQALHVAKPILETVIFCHQEDSTWPLQEAAVLKKKFDDIFESSRYSKAMEELKKQRKRLNDVANTAEKEKLVFDAHRKVAQKLEGEQAEIQMKQDEIEHEVGAIKEAISENCQKLAKLEDLVKGYEDKMKEIDLVRREFKQRKEALGKKKERLLRSAYWDSMKDQPQQILAETLKKEENTKMETERQHKKVEFSLKKKQDDLEEYVRRKQELEILYTQLQTQLQYQLDAEVNLLKDLDDLCRKYPGTQAVASRLAEIKASLQGSGGAVQASTKKEHHDTVETAFSTLWDLQSETRDKLEKKFAENEELFDKERTKRTKHFSDMSVDESKLESLRVSLKTYGEEQSAANSELKMLASTGQADADLDDVIQQSIADRTKLQGELESVVSQLKNLKLSIQSKQATIGKMKQQVEELEQQHGNVLRYQSVVDEVKRRRGGQMDAFSRINPEKDYLKTELELDGTDVLCAKLEECLQTPIGSFRMFDVTEAEDLAERLHSLLASQSRNFQKQIEAIKTETRRLKDGLLGRKADRKNTEKQITELEQEMQKLAKVSIREEYLEGIPDTFEGKKVDYILQKLHTARDLARDKLEISKRNVFMLESAVKQTLRKVRKNLAHIGCPTCQHGLQEYSIKKPDGNYTIGNELFSAYFDEQGGSYRLKKDVYAVFEDGKSTTKVSYKVGDVLHGPQLFICAISIQLMGGETSRVQLAISQQKIAYKKALDAHEDFVKLAPRIERKMELEQKFKELREQNTVVINEIQKAEGEINSLDDKLEAISGKAERLDVIIKDVDVVIRLFTEIQEQVNEGAELEDQIGDAIVSSSHDNSPLESARKDLTAEDTALQKLNVDRDGLIQRQSDLHANIQECNTKQNKAEQTKLDIRRSRTKQEELIKRKQELAVKIKAGKAEELSLKARVKENKEQLKKLDDSFETIKNKRTESYTKLKKEENELRSALDLLGRTRRDMEAKQREANIPEKLVETEKQQKELANELGKAKGEKEEAFKEEKRLQQVVNTHNDFMNTLQQFLDYQEEKTRVYDLKAQVNSAREENELQATNNCKEEKMALEAENKRKENSCSKLEGRMQELVGRMKVVKSRLRQEEYYEIEKRFKEANIKFMTTKMACQDLDMYYTALDTALMQFHAMKIDEINKHIKELWSIMYKGGDIERIELRSDKTSNRKTGRSYNYRVIMTKDRTELDMRGRCSAGQKVLASLVIRMALAETFSASCGIISLDEPTTNLDEENKKGLADALMRIMEHHKGERAYQLIVITHDTEFVNQLEEKIQLGGQEADFYTVFRKQDRNGHYVSNIRQTGNDDTE
uniref:Rad50/SbcC-type AAA domain-containing protein n=1 Tax=Mucochytrium quahogii TaxID=96639 RepID=A0A7S2WJF7_9STRA|mmetsp:Transcript_3097/g.5858  ORF Transcript_3097/g.5858 Transcript_3097/m.5858 type:complete len:1458 (-) Transcript_3097:147-4520(-)|eukprot:CAMPEP_0203763066 /NCGR_PEP_ID=MMETSP0098-20131031/15773_1 /ASSEMBLY_ACC=CAM_ASM_000208 /TAXON_ID=96639 /ORGANISM=" , Strain NY0313808BC1" /LENGTH=1457 /DNA_ID=CAMNT_0050657669 /DNA_START=389 /DNA_END=4762 /DNA_ORIENTATION=-